MTELSYNSIKNIFENLLMRRSEEAIKELQKEVDEYGKSISEIAIENMEQDNRSTILPRDIRAGIREHKN